MENKQFLQEVREREIARTNYFFEKSLIVSLLTGYLEGTIKSNDYFSKEVIKYATELKQLIEEEVSKLKDY